jgi:hypothetical protein
MRDTVAAENPCDRRFSAQELFNLVKRVGFLREWRSHRHRGCGCYLKNLSPIKMGLVHSSFTGNNVPAYNSAHTVRALRGASSAQAGV